MESNLAAAEFVSLVLTVPTIVVALVVIIVWWSPVKSFFSLEKWTSSEYLIIGVFLGFVGGFLDNLYWAIPWSMTYLNMDPESTNWWFTRGCYPNIFSRQILGTLAGYCHIKSFLIHKSKNTDEKKYLSILALLTAIGALSLYVFKKT